MPDEEIGPICSLLVASDKRIGIKDIPLIFSWFCAFNGVLLLIWWCAQISGQRPQQGSSEQTSLFKYYSPIIGALRIMRLWLWLAWVFHACRIALCSEDYGLRRLPTRTSMKRTESDSDIDFHRLDKWVHLSLRAPFLTKSSWGNRS